jgi:hypothetical protein
MPPQIGCSANASVLLANGFHKQRRNPDKRWAGCCSIGLRYSAPLLRAVTKPPNTAGGVGGTLVDDLEMLSAYKQLKTPITATRAFASPIARQPYPVKASGGDPYTTGAQWDASPSLPRPWGGSSVTCHHIPLQRLGRARSGRSG